MISVTKNIRSAAIVATAIAALAGTGALAQNLSTAGATHNSSSNSSSALKATPSAEPSDSPDASPKADATPNASKTGVPGGAHGACVSAVAQNKSAVVDNGHGQKTHGARVSKAAHDCPK